MEHPLKVKPPGSGLPHTAEVWSIDEVRARRGLPRAPQERRPCMCPKCAWDREVLAMLDELKVEGYKEP